MEKMAPEGSKQRAMALTGSVGSVVGGGVAGAVLAGPAAPIGFVVGALVGGLVVAGVLVSDGVLDEQATEADYEQPTNAKLEDALLGKFRGGNGSGSDAGSRPDGGNGSSGSTGPNTNTDLFSRLAGKRPNPWLPAQPAKSGGNGSNGGNGPDGGNGSGDARGAASKVGQGGGNVVNEAGGGNAGAASTSPLDRLSTMWSEWTTKDDCVSGEEEQAWKTK